MMEFASTCVPQRILVLKDSPSFPKGTRLFASGNSGWKTPQLLGEGLSSSLLSVGLEVKNS